MKKLLESYRDRIKTSMKDIARVMQIGVIDITILQLILDVIFWNKSIKYLAADIPYAIWWYVYMPTVVSAIIGSMLYVFEAVNKKYRKAHLETTKWYGFRYRFIGSFLYAMFYASWVYYYYDFPSTKILYVVILCLAALFQDIWWALLELMWVIIIYLWNHFGIASFRHLRVENPPEWIDLTLGIVILMLASGFVIFIVYNKYSLEKNVQLEKELGETKLRFLASMSHEIRTPINAMLGMNEMIMREAKEDSISEYAAGIENAGNLLLSLVNDILDFSKLEAGKFEIIPVEYKLRNVVNDLVNMSKKRAESKNLKIVTKIDKETPNNLVGDEIRIKQIITNLLTNAIKYSDAGTVTLEISSKYINKKEVDMTFSVRDTGCGIEGNLSDLFNAFNRVNEKAYRNVEGTGLGLAIVKYLLDIMGGTIDVTSEAGKGSCFTVTLRQIAVNDEPIGEFTEGALVAAPVERKGVAFTAPEVKILVVDDNLTNIKVATLLLKRTQIQTKSATGGLEAIEILKNEKFDLILLDHMMPDMDGIETLEKIREFDSVTPAVALTANALSGAREMYISKGFVEYLSKPIKGTDLEQLLIKLLPKDKIVIT